MTIVKLGLAGGCLSLLPSISPRFHRPKSCQPRLDRLQKPINPRLSLLRYLTCRRNPLDSLPPSPLLLQGWEPAFVEPSPGLVKWFSRWTGKGIQRDGGVRRVVGSSVSPLKTCLLVDTTIVFKIMVVVSGYLVLRCHGHQS